MKILYLIFHPDFENSKVTKTWSRVLEESGQISERREIFGLYPDFNIDVEAEQSALLKADRIVFQFPFYWYSAPAILKQYLDSVFSFNFAFGPKGDKLAKKEMQILVSIGGPAESYIPGGYNNFTPTEFLRPFEQTANLTKMSYLPPLFMHKSVVATPEQVKEFAKEALEAILDEDRANPFS